MIVERALMWIYRVSHCQTFSVNSLCIIEVCYKGMLVLQVSFGRVVPLHQALSHIDACKQLNQYWDDLQTSSLWYQLMYYYTGNLCANFEEAPGRAHKRTRYVCLTMSLHWFILWLGAAYSTHYCLNKWWHKPAIYICVTLPNSVNTWRPRKNCHHLPDDIFNFL